MDCNLYRPVNCNLASIHGEIKKPRVSSVASGCRRGGFGGEFGSEFSGCRSRKNWGYFYHPPIGFQGYYHLVMTLPVRHGKSPFLSSVNHLIISMGHLYHGELLVTTRLGTLLKRGWCWLSDLRKIMVWCVIFGLLEVTQSMVSIALFSGKNAATGRTLKMNIQQDAEKNHQLQWAKWYRPGKMALENKISNPKHQDFHRF